MNKKIVSVVLVMSAFIVGGLLPRPDGLKQDQECKAGWQVKKK